MRLVERHTALSVRSDGNSPRGQLVEQLGLPVESEPHALRDGDRITEKAERARRRNRRIEYAQGARRRVARIRIHRLARLYALGVHSLEAAEGHVHLAANLHQRWMATAFEPQGNLAIRSDVGGDVLAYGTVPARRAGHEHAVAIGQAHCRAVDLELAIVAGAPHFFARQSDNPLLPCRELVFVEGVA